MGASRTFSSHSARLDARAASRPLAALTSTAEKREDNLRSPARTELLDSSTSASESWVSASRLTGWG
eukprot:5186371-Prymnesium_polylepis.1